MQAPKIKIKFNTGVNTTLTLATLLIILLELYWVYTYIYKNFTVVTIQTSDAKIVRVDNNSYKSTIDLLQGLKDYTLNNSLPNNPNPLQ